MTTNNEEAPQIILYDEEPEGFKIRGLKDATYLGWRYGFASKAMPDSTHEACWIRLGKELED